MYRSIEEVEKALSDRSYAESVMAAVSKGGKGTFSYIPWNATVKLLDRIFGPFGWGARITHTANDFERGIYRTDLELQVNVLTEDGEGRKAIISKTLPGTGVGIVVGQSNDAHDTAIKASRSDALSVAAKSLGDAFGLFLYDRGDPARSTPTNTDSVQSQKITNGNKSEDLGNRPSEKQVAILLKDGYSQQQLDAMPFRVWKSCMDAHFGKGEALAVPASKMRQAKAPAPKTDDDALGVDDVF